MAQRENKRIDYGLELPDIGAPVKGNEGEHLARAGAYEGEAAATAGKATAGAITFLGTNVLEAYKGSLLADESKEIDATLNKMEGSPAMVEAASAQAGKLAMLGETPAADEPTFLQDFRNSVARYTTAADQGALTKEQVIDRIAATVKKYSATMPGWASDFRKVAADMTGIERIDIYGIHAALTRQAAGNRAAEDIRKRNLNLLEGFARENGILTMEEAASPKWADARAYYMQEKQSEIQAKALERKTKVKGMAQKESDAVHTQLAYTLFNKEVTHLASKMTEFITLNRDTTDNMKAKDAAMALSGEISAMRSRITNSVAVMMQPGADRPNVLSVEAGQTLIKDWTAILNTYEDSVKNIESRNLFVAMVEGSAKKKESLMNNFYLAHPILLAHKDMGVADELYKVYVSVTEEDFTKRFGAELGKAMKSLRTGAGFQHYAATLAAGAKGEKIDFAGLARDPATRTSVIVSMRHNIEEWSKDPNPTPEKKESFTNVFSQFTEQLVKSNKTTDLAVVNDILTNPATQKFLGTLSTNQRIVALRPAVKAMEDNAAATLSQLFTEVAAANQPSNRTASFPNAKVSLGVDALTGQIKVIVDDGMMVDRSARFTEMPSGAAGVGPGYMFNFGNKARDAGLSSLRGANVQQAEKLAAQLDTTLQSYTASMRLMSPDLNTTLDKVRQRVLAGQHPEPGFGAVEGLQTPKDSDNVNPKAGEPTAYNEEKLLAATAAIESGGNPNAVSPKNAVGKYQFIEDTGRRFGLKIDAAAGIDERKDTEKSKEAARKYYRFLNKEFNGDLEMIVAAYNAGETAVKTAVEKARAYGLPDQWKGELIRMGGTGPHSYLKETIPHIKKVMEAYKR